MSTSPTSPDTDPARSLRLLGEFRALDRDRVGAGLTPLEYQRWLDLKRMLDARLQPTPDPTEPPRLRVEYRDEAKLVASLIRELPQGGLFVGTPFAPEIGTELVLCIHVRSTGESVELPGIVVSNNVGDGFSTAELGMGVRLRRLDAEQRAWAERVGAIAPVEDTSEG